MRRFYIKRKDLSHFPFQFYIDRNGVERQLEKGYTFTFAIEPPKDTRVAPELGRCEASLTCAACGRAKASVVDGLKGLGYAALRAKTRGNCLPPDPASTASTVVDAVKLSVSEDTTALPSVASTHHR